MDMSEDAHHYRIDYNADDVRERENGLNIGVVQDVQGIDFIGALVHPNTTSASNAGGDADSVSIFDAHGEFESGSHAQNRLGVNIVRSFFGPDLSPTQASTDSARRIGPSAYGQHPEIQDQQYQLIAVFDGINQETVGPVPLCVSTQTGHVCECFTSPCTTDQTKFVGIGDGVGVIPNGQLVYYTFTGQVSGLDCSGVIAIGDKVRMQGTGLDPYALITDNEATAGVVVGIATSTCGGSVNLLNPSGVDVLLRPKGGSSTKQWFPAAQCLYAVKATNTPTPSPTPTPTASTTAGAGATATRSPTPTRTPTPTATATGAASPTATATPTPTITPSPAAIINPQLNTFLNVNFSPVAVCVGGANTVKGVLDFPDSIFTCVEAQWMLPTDWTSSVTGKIRWFSEATSGAVAWAFNAVCVADGATDDPAYGTSTGFSDVAKPVADQMNDKQVAFLTATLSTCSPGNLIHLRLCRDGTAANDTMVGTAHLYGIEMSFSR